MNEHMSVTNLRIFLIMVKIKRFELVLSTTN